MTILLHFLINLCCLFAYVSGNKIDSEFEYNGFNGIETFYNIAKSQDVISDKIVHTHDYEIMYGLFLIPLREKLKKERKNIKLLEIGLGCNMKYGPGASAILWDVLFPTGELWMAEYDKECVAKSKEKLSRYHVLVGDQGNKTVLNEWVLQSGGGFHVIIDDGGHKNSQILNSLYSLWPTLAPGGIYFIEDLLVGTDHRLNRDISYLDGKKFPPTVAVIQAWIHYLVIDQNFDKTQGMHNLHKNILERYPPLENMEFIFCQTSACAIRKKVLKQDSYK